MDNERVTDFKNAGGSTSAATGVRLAVSEMKKTHRPNTRLIVVHISDGNSQVGCRLIEICHPGE
jgi:Mg-chelatase subunit ChlD